jgi:hypothetical protein
MRTAIFLSLLFAVAFCSHALPWSKRLGNSLDKPNSGLIRRHISLRSPWAYENSDRFPIPRKTLQKAIKSAAEKRAHRKDKKPHTTKAPDIHIGQDQRDEEPLADKELPKADPDQSMYPKDEPRDDVPLSDKKNIISTFGPSKKPKRHPIRVFLGQKRRSEDEALAELNTFMATAVEAYNRRVENVNHGKKKASKKFKNSPQKFSRVLVPKVKDEELSQKRVFTGVTAPRRQNKSEALRRVNIGNVALMRVNPQGASQDEEDLSDFRRFNIVKRPVVNERNPRFVEQLSDLNTFLNTGVDYALNRAVTSNENTGKKKAKKSKKSKKSETLADHKKTTSYTLKPSRKPAIIGSLADLKGTFRQKLEKIHNDRNSYLMEWGFRREEEQLAEQEVTKPIRKRRGILRAQELHGIRTPAAIRLHKNPFIDGGFVGDDYETPLRTMSEQRDSITNYRRSYLDEVQSDQKSGKKNFDLKNTQEPFGVLSDKKKKKSIDGIEKENMNIRNPNSPFDLEMQTGTSTVFTTKNSNSPFETESDVKNRKGVMRLRNPNSPFVTESDKNKKNKWNEAKGGKRNVKHF